MSSNPRLYKIKTIRTDWNWLDEHHKLLHSHKPARLSPSVRLKKLIPKSPILTNTPPSSSLHPTPINSRAPSLPRRVPHLGQISQRSSSSLRPEPKTLSKSVASIKSDPEKIVNMYYFLGRQDDKMLKTIENLPFLKHYKKYLGERNLRLPGFIKSKSSHKTVEYHNSYVIWIQSL